MMASPSATPTPAQRATAARGMVMGVMFLRNIGLIDDDDVLAQMRAILGHAPDSAEALEIMREAQQKIVRRN